MKTRKRPDEPVRPGPSSGQTQGEVPGVGDDPPRHTQEPVAQAFGFQRRGFPWNAPASRTT